MQIITLIEGAGFTEDCVLGLKICSEETACPVHAKWRPIKEKIVALLHEQTLGRLSSAVISGKYRICDLPMAMMEEMRAKGV